MASMTERAAKVREFESNIEAAEVAVRNAIQPLVDLTNVANAMEKAGTGDSLSPIEREWLLSEDGKAPMSLRTVRELESVLEDCEGWLCVADDLLEQLK